MHAVDSALLGNVSPHAFADDVRRALSLRWMLVLVASGALAAGVGAFVDLSWLFLGGCLLLLVASFKEPRLGVFVLLAMAVVFREETWQAGFFGGSPESASTLYTYDFHGLKVEYALGAGAFLGTLIAVRKLPLRWKEPFVLALLALLVADVWGEVWGRIQTGYSAHLFGHWVMLAAPVLLALVVRAWATRENVAFALRWLTVVAVGRLLFGLIRLAAGGGDVHWQLGRRIVFFDWADGMVAVLVCGVGALLVVAPRLRWPQRLVGLVLVLLGAAVIDLSFRRLAMVASMVMVVTVVALTWRRRPLVAAVAAVAAATVWFGVLNPPLPGAGSLRARTGSIVKVDVKREQAAKDEQTNEFHVAELKDGLLHIAERPLQGWGYRTAPPRKVAYLQRPQFSLARINVYHDLYVNTWFRLGILGILGLAATVVLGLRAGVVSLRRDGPPETVILFALAAAMAAASFFAPVSNSYRLPLFLFAPLAALVALAPPMRSGASGPSAAEGHAEH